MPTPSIPALGTDEQALQQKAGAAPRLAIAASVFDQLFVGRLEQRDAVVARVGVQEIRGDRLADVVTDAEAQQVAIEPAAALHVGDQILDATLDGTPLRFFYSVTRDSRDGKLYLKMVNATASPRTLTIRLKGVSQVSKNGKLISMSAKTTESTNTILDTKKIVPKESTIGNAAAQFSHTLPTYSIQVMELEAH